MTKKIKVIVIAVLVAVIAGMSALMIASAYSENNGKKNYGIKPTITVTVPDEYTLNNAPFAVLNKPYKIFSAVANDVYGDVISVDVNVYAYYDSENKLLVGYDNGYVVPNEYGVYTVEYSATDAFGNNAIILYDFECVDKKPLSAELSSTVSTFKAGEEIVVPEIAFENNVGKVNVEITASLAGGSISYTVENGKFTPKYAGQYVVRYEYADYNESGVKEFNVTVSTNNAPVVYGDASVPKYFIVGCQYKLPSLDCYHFTNGQPNKVVPQITVKIGDYKPVSVGADFKFTPAYEGKTVVTYTALNQVVKTYEAVTVSANYGTPELQMAKYFYSPTGNVDIKALSHGISLTSYYEGAKVDFINSLVSERFNLDFGILPESNYSKLNIYLTDVKNENIKVKFSVVKNQGKDTSFIVNDGEKAVTNVAFDTLNTYTFKYLNATKTAMVGTSFELTIDKTLSGEKFEGFTGNMVYVTLEFEDVKSSGGVVIYKLNNQPLSSSGRDTIEPYLVFHDYSGNELNIGDKMLIGRIYVGDVLDPNYSVSYYIQKPDGTFAVSDDGIELSSANAKYDVDYVVTADMNGRYLIYMSPSDSRNNLPQSYTIEVVDGVPPTINLSADGDLTGSVGKEIKLRTPTVSDDVTQAMTVSVYVLKPNGKLENVSVHSLKYTPDVAGEYSVYYYAIDERGNAVINEYTVAIK